MTRLARTKKHLEDLGIKFKYSERENLGRIQIGDKLIYEHYRNTRNPKLDSVFYMAEEINLISESQLIAWISTNEDRLKR